MNYIKVWRGQEDLYCVFVEKRMIGCLWHGSVSEVYEGGARYVRGQQDCGEVCGRND